MSFRPGDHVFVDESKARGYRLAAVAIAPADVAPVERRLRSLRAGRSTIHFTEEVNRRDALLREIATLPVRSTVYLMTAAPDRIARPALLRRMAADLLEERVAHLVLERDASVEKADRQVLRAELTRRAALDRLTYLHRDRREQPALWVADAICWCHQKGGPWSAKVDGLVDAVIRLEAP